VTTNPWHRGIYKSTPIHKEIIHFNNLASVSKHTSSFPDDFSGENEIFEDFIVDMGQCAGHGTGLFLTALATWFRHNATLTDEYNVTIRELLFEFTSQSE
jgi:hypothetical protein